MEESTFRIIQGEPGQESYLVKEKSEGQKRHSLLLDDAEKALAVASDALAEAVDLLSVVMHVDSRAQHEIQRIRETVANHRRLKL